MKSETIRLKDTHTGYAKGDAVPATDVDNRKLGNRILDDLFNELQKSQDIHGLLKELRSYLFNEYVEEDLNIKVNEEESPIGYFEKIEEMICLIRKENYNSIEILQMFKVNFC